MAAAAAVVLQLLLLLGGDSCGITNSCSVATASAASASASASASDVRAGDDDNAAKVEDRRKLYLKHYPEPTLKWETRLPDTGTVVSGSPGPRRQNAVQISPDDALVYVTLDDGTLHILDALTGTPTASYTPEKSTQTGATGQTVCTSGVSFYTDRNDNVEYAVYAVIDTSASGFVPTSSRVVAINHPTGDVRWVSGPIQGTISGTPQVGSDGEYIYLTRNLDPEDDSRRADGHFSLLTTANGQIIFTEASSTYLGGNETGPYAPLALVHNPTSGNFGDGEGNNNRNDVAVWAQSNGGGKVLNGMSFAFQLPSNADIVSGTTTFKPYLLKVNGWSTAAKPTLSYDGQNLYFTASKASLRGWNTRFGRRASWKAEQLDTARNGRLPLNNAATLSIDERSLFVASGANSFYSIDAYSGETQWREESDSPFVTEARVSPDGTRVYSIEQANGKVVSRDAETGDAVWAVSCATYDAFNPFCQYNVDAEFSLSSDGYDLYYGDVLGSVRSLVVGFDAPPSMPPTMSPTVTQTGSPTPVSPSPTAAATTAAPTIVTDEPTGRPTDPPTPEPLDDWTTTSSAHASRVGFSAVCLMILLAYLTL